MSDTAHRLDVLRDEMTDFIRRYRWDHYITLTHRYPVSEARHKKEIAKMLRKWERVAQGRVSYVAFPERTTVGYLHAHLLIHGTGHLQNRELQRKWPWGLSKMERFDPEGGAARYVAKAYGQSEAPEWDISHVVPPRHEESEREAPSRRRPSGHMQAGLYRREQYGQSAARWEAQRQRKQHLAAAEQIQEIYR